MVLECAAHLFARGEPGHFSPSLDRINAWWSIHHPGCVPARSRGLYPAEASLFAVSMLLFTEGGNTYSVSETAKWLKDAGFITPKSLPIRKGTEDWEDGVLEASAPGQRPKTIDRRI